MTEPIRLVCEGSSDEAFFRELIKNRKLVGIDVPYWPDNISRGVSSFYTMLKGLQTNAAWSETKLIVVVADNDDNPLSRFGDVQRAIREAENFGVPGKPRVIALPGNIPDGRTVPDIAVLMLPWEGVEGNLETILYQAGSEKNKNLSKCVEQFTGCVTAKSKSKWDIAKLSKLKARCLLSGSAIKNPDVPIAGAWRSDNGEPFPLDSKRFDALVNYLKELVRHVSVKPVKKQAGVRTRMGRSKKNQ